MSHIDFTAEIKTSRWKEWARRLGPRGGMALADQAAVGAAGFVTSIIVGRVCGPAEFGLFALGMTLVILLVGVLESLITSPYVVFVSRLDPEERRAYAGSVILQYALLLGLVSALLAVAAAVTGYWQLGPAGLPAVLVTLAALSPLRLLRELTRRLAYADLDVRSALGVGLSVLILQVSAVGGLALVHRLNAVTALIAISLTSGVAGGGWLLVHRSGLYLAGGRFRWAMSRSYQLGGWFFAAQTLAIFGSHTLPWLVAIALDKEDAGIYAACAAIVSLANPLVYSASNMLTPLTSHAFAQRGIEGVRRVVFHATLLLGGLAVCMCVFLLFAGNWTLSLLFGDKFTGFGTLIAILALGEALAIAVMPLGRAVMVFERPSIGFVASLASIIVTLTTALLTMPQVGVMGAAAGRLAGAALSTVILIVGYRLLLRVLRQNEQASEPVTTDPLEPAESTGGAPLPQAGSASPTYSPRVELVENLP